MNAFVKKQLSKRIAANLFKMLLISKKRPQKNRNSTFSFAFPFFNVQDDQTIKNYFIKILSPAEKFITTRIWHFITHRTKNANLNVPINARRIFHVLMLLLKKDFQHLRIHKLFSTAEEISSIVRMKTSIS